MSDELEGMRNEAAMANRGIVLIFSWRTEVQTNIQTTPWPLVRKRTTPTERPSLVDEI
jgi:hypothetical protein